MHVKRVQTLASSRKAGSSQALLIRKSRQFRALAGLVREGCSGTSMNVMVQSRTLQYLRDCCPSGIFVQHLAPWRSLLEPFQPSRPAKRRRGAELQDLGGRAPFESGGEERGSPAPCCIAGCSMGRGSGFRAPRETGVHEMGGLGRGERAHSQRTKPLWVFVVRYGTIPR